MPSDLVKLTEDMKDLVRKQKLGFVASVSPEGSPNLSPKGTTTIWDDNHVMFADIASPKTVKNLKNNPSVEINVVDPFVRKGYRFKGKATVYTKEYNGVAFDEFMNFYKKEVQDAEKRIKSIVLIDVETAEALISPAYDFPVSEHEVTQKWKKYYNDIDHFTKIEVEHLSD